MTFMEAEHDKEKNKITSDPASFGRDIQVRPKNFGDQLRRVIAGNRCSRGPGRSKKEWRSVSR